MSKTFWVKSFDISCDPRYKKWYVGAFYGKPVETATIKIAQPLMFQFRFTELMGIELKEGEAKEVKLVEVSGD